MSNHLLHVSGRQKILTSLLAAMRTALLANLNKAYFSSCIGVDVGKGTSLCWNSPTLTRFGLLICSSLQLKPQETISMLYLAANSFVSSDTEISLAINFKLINIFSNNNISLLIINNPFLLRNYFLLTVCYHHTKFFALYPILLSEVVLENFQYSQIL